MFTYQIMDIFPDLYVAADETVGEETGKDGQSHRHYTAEEEEIAAAVGADSQAAQHSYC